MSSRIKVDDDNIITNTGFDDSAPLTKGEIPTGCHEYEFKVISCDRWRGFGNVVIGIVPKSSLSEIEDAVDNWLFHIGGYYFIGTHSAVGWGTIEPDETPKDAVHHKIEIENDSIIKMIVDLDNLELRYYVNDVYVAWIGGIRKKEYLAAIYLFCENVKVQLIPWVLIIVDNDKEKENGNKNKFEKSERLRKNICSWSVFFCNCKCTLLA